MMYVLFSHQVSREYGYTRQTVCTVHTLNKLLYPNLCMYPRTVDDLFVRIEFVRSNKA